ncbi:hypothetical protein JCM17960_25920 [Magnetospira thiophila]
MGLRLLYGIVLLLVVAGETVLLAFSGRLVAPTLGSSTAVWTPVLAVALAGFIFGISGRPGSTPQPKVWQWRSAWGLALSCLWLLALPHGFPHVLFALRRVADITALHSLVLGGALFGPLFWLLGKSSLALAVLTGARRPLLRAAWGVPVGLMLSEFLFIDHLGTSGTFIALAVLFGVLALGLALAAPRRALLLVGLTLGGYALPASWEGFPHCDAETRDGCLDIRTLPEAKRLLLDNQSLGLVDRENVAHLLAPTDQFIDTYAGLYFGAERPPRSLILNGGASPLPHAWVQRYFGRIPPGMFLVSDPTPVVSRMAAVRLNFRPSPAIQLDHRDGRRLVESLPDVGGIDLIVGSRTLPSTMMTQEFHDQLAARMTHDGIYMLPVVDNGDTPRLLFHLFKTLETTFPEVDLWMRRDRAGSPFVQPYVLIAGQTAPSLSLAMESGWVRWPKTDLHPRIAAAETIVLTDDFAPIDALRGPSQPFSAFAELQ